ncbi:MAG TPA: hypothetical protein VNX18_10820 [Bryobacteraceae bacterium]|jgi:hypothetical protein|nr:hypothetical protein [Bryobacteraceae bacterium]
MESINVKVADECWIALAQLTQAHPDRKSFTAKEILNRIREAPAHLELRPGVQAHIHLHNIANLPPNTARYRMFYRLEDGTYRLYRPGDPHHAERRGKISPRRDELPVRYHSLLDWYETEYCSGHSAPPRGADDPILQLRGLGKKLWIGIDADKFVDELRSGWSAVAPAATTDDTGDVWRRVVRYQGDEFKTVTGLPFTYQVEGASGIWFFRDGNRINRRLGKRELESALQKCPLHGPADLREFQDPSYLFGLLTDRRIIGQD